jgi:hypothetical protein
VNSQGYPVPWFAAHPERLTEVDRAKKPRAIAERLCWICGKPLHRALCFVLGPAQAAMRTAQEPPSHRGCAQFAVTTCPFMLSPDYHRSDTDRAAHALHNPGCFAVWQADAYEVAADGRLAVGAPQAVAWFRAGRPAMREEVLRALDGYLARLDPADVGALLPWLPLR